MRLLHTSDWHLGKVTNAISRRPDHECTVAEMLAIAREFEPDLVLHTGDLFDAFLPSADDMRLAMDALGELAAIAPVTVLCGDRENPKLFALLERIRGNDRLRFIDKPRRPAEGGILEYGTSGCERIRLAALPYVRNTTNIRASGNAAAWTTAYGAALADCDPERDIAIFAAHLHVTGATFAGSERKAQLNDPQTRPEAIPVVTYAAFGHIKKPQDIGGRNWARYAGSPIPIDFGELDEQKSVVLVEAKPGGKVRRELAGLSGGRPLRQVRGTLAEIRERADGLSGTLARVVVEHSGSANAVYDRVAELLPKTILLTVEVLDPDRQIEPIESAGDVAEPGLGDLFGAFVSEKANPGRRREARCGMF
jgi:exonuclease SbcD